MKRVMGVSEPDRSWHKLAISQGEGDLREVVAEHLYKEKYANARRRYSIG